MQQLSVRNLVVDGVSVFGDHADPNHFWYLPAPVRIHRRENDQRAALTYIRYRPAAVEGGARGGGFLMFQTDLRLEPAQERRIKAAVSQLAGGEVTLAPIPFDSGAVECVALDLQGTGGTEADPPPEGTIRAVETILGASVPSLAGDNTAMFSLTLSQEGATILDQALEQGTSPVGVIYRLGYSILHPSLNVRIEADLEKIYTHFSASLEGQYYFVKAGIDAGFERLVQEGAIRIEVLDFTGEEDEKEKEKWALDFFKDNLLSDWFTPTLGTFKGVWDDEGRGGTTPAPGGTSTSPGGGGTPGGGSTPSGGTTPTRGTTPSSGETPGGGNSSGRVDATNPGTASAREGAAASGTGTRTETRTEPATEPQPAPRQPAAWNVTATRPSPVPADRRVEFRPSESGNRETLVFHGGNAPPSVTVDGASATLEDRTLTLDVPAGTSREVVALWPGMEPRTFQAFFDYDEPVGSGHRNFELAPALRAQYLAGTAPDQQFNDSTPPDGCGHGSGAAALKHWLRNCLRTDMVNIEAHASWEDRPEADEHNLRLSRRRQEIAEAFARDAGVAIRVAAHQGAARARAARRVSSPSAPSPDRVVEISEQIQAEPEVEIQGILTRPTAPDRPAPPRPPTPPGPPAPPGGPTPPTPPGGPTPPGEIPGAPQLTFRLRFIRQEERKRFVMVYNRTGAVKRTYAPQGFIGLLAGDLDEREKHFVEVDLDDPFFRQLKLEVEAPVDLGRIGLASAHVQVSYGDPDDRNGERHRDFVFRPGQTGPLTEGFFMSGPGDVTYRRTTRYHFSPDSDWAGERTSYEWQRPDAEERMVVVNPAEHLDFHEVRLAPGDVDWGMVRILEADVTYDSPSGWRSTRSFTFTESDPEEQLWRIRTPRGDPFDYRLVVRSHLQDGSFRESEAVVASGTMVVLNDPFDGALEVDFIPAFPPGAVRTVFVDVEYSDPANGYRRRERLEVDGEEPARASVRFALVDPEHRTFQYRVTFLGNDHRMIRLPSAETEDTLVALALPDADGGG